MNDLFLVFDCGVTLCEGRSLLITVLRWFVSILFVLFLLCMCV